MSSKRYFLAKSMKPFIGLFGLSAFACEALGSFSFFLAGELGGEEADDDARALALATGMALPATTGSETPGEAPGVVEALPNSKRRNLEKGNPLSCHVLTSFHLITCRKGRACARPQDDLAASRRRPRPIRGRRECRSARPSGEDERNTSLQWGERNDEVRRFHMAGAFGA